MLGRREFVGAGALALLAGRGAAARTISIQGGPAVEEMYGLIGQIQAVPGKRDELLAYLLEGSDQMPGNVAYIVARDAKDADSIWITEVWQTKTDHANSLNLPAVRAAIEKARPIIAGFGQRVETVPIYFE